MVEQSYGNKVVREVGRRSARHMPALMLFFSYLERSLTGVLCKTGTKGFYFACFFVFVFLLLFFYCCIPITEFDSLSVCVSLSSLYRENFSLDAWKIFSPLIKTHDSSVWRHAQHVALSETPPQGNSHQCLYT